MLKVSFVGKTNDPLGEIIKEVQEEEIRIKEQINNLGLETSLEMKKIINDNKVRPQSDEATVLENNIDVEYFTEGGWGVGDIDTLKSHAPWWAAINFGSSHMVGKRLPLGTFNPSEPKPTQSMFRLGRWKKGEDYNGEMYSPIVKKPILATNFIEKTAFWLVNKIDSLKG
jgi:hypothetical protein